MQWVCSLRDSLQGPDELTLPIRPTNRLPTSLNSSLAALKRGRPNGHREAPLLHLQLFKSSTGHSSMQIANRLILSAHSRLPENSNRLRITQPLPAVERSRNLWETTQQPRQIRRLLPRNNPQVRQPVHEKLHRQRHQQQPHDPDQDADTCFPQHCPDASCPS